MRPRRETVVAAPASDGAMTGGVCMLSVGVALLTLTALFSACGAATSVVLTPCASENYKYNYYGVQCVTLTHSHGRCERFSDQTYHMPGYNPRSHSSRSLSPPSLPLPLVPSASSFPVLRVA